MVLGARAHKGGANAMSYDLVKSPTLSVRNALRRYGGYSRLFNRSLETREQQDIVWCQKEEGFWEEWRRVRIDECLREEVAKEVKEFRRAYPQLKLAKGDLENRLRSAILRNGWKPPLGKIRKEIAEYKKQRKDEISWLKKTVRK